MHLLACAEVSCPGGEDLSTHLLRACVGVGVVAAHRSSSGIGERIFPLLIDKRAESFHYDSCNFKVQKNRGSCARISVCREFKLQQSYTLEASFCGASQGRNKNAQFTTCDFEEMGINFCEALSDLVSKAGRPLVRVAQRELEASHPQKMKREREKQRNSGSGRKDSSKGDGGSGVAGWASYSQLEGWDTTGSDGPTDNGTKAGGRRPSAKGSGAAKRPTRRRSINKRPSFG